MTTSAPKSASAPIVLIHGATSSARAWDPLLPKLSQTHAVFTPNLAGHRGGPPLPAGAAGIVDKLVDNMCRQLDDAAIDTAHMVGNSLGGWVALELGRRGRAQSVLALSPAGAWRSARDLRRLLTLFRAGALMGRLNNASGLMAHRHVRRLLLLLMAEHGDRVPPTELAAAFEDIAACTALPEIVTGARTNGPIKPMADVGCRVCIAWGMKDRMLPFMRYGAPMLLAVPAAEFKILPSVGHVPMVDDPDLVAQTILDFVAITG